MHATSTQTQTAGSTQSWDDDIVRRLHRHMRINFRYLSPAVRQMTLRQSMEDIEPSRGPEALIQDVEHKLSR